MKKDKILKGEEKEQAEMEFGIQEGIEDGTIEVVEVNGEKQYKITPYGASYVEAMPFATDREKTLWMENYKLKQRIKDLEAGKF